MLGRRHACCTEACRAVFAVSEYERSEEWLSYILVTSRGIGASLATTALYTNLHPAKHRRIG